MATDTRISCPDCGGPMRQTRRGATLKKRGPAYVCPAAEGEVYADERGHLKRIADARHAYTRSWQAWELERLTDAAENRTDLDREGQIAELVKALTNLTAIVESRFEGLEIVALVPRELRTAVDDARKAITMTTGENRSV
jgi:hypothetical protein